jgi:hypothetical protein
LLLVEAPHNCKFGPGKDSRIDKCIQEEADSPRNFGKDLPDYTVFFPRRTIFIVTEVKTSDLRFIIYVKVGGDSWYPSPECLNTRLPA